VPHAASDPVDPTTGPLPPRVFVDTSYVIALFVRQDQHHVTAQALAARMARARTRFVTTQAVLLEIGNALAKQRYRAAALQILQALESDPATQVVPMSDVLYGRGRDLYEARADQEWGLTDCLSFVVMRELGLTDALTADRHFEQAGYHALLQAATK